MVSAESFTNLAGATAKKAVYDSCRLLPPDAGCEWMIAVTKDHERFTTRWDAVKDDLCCILSAHIAVSWAFLVPIAALRRYPLVCASME